MHLARVSLPESDVPLRLLGRDGDALATLPAAAVGWVGPAPPAAPMPFAPPGCAGFAVAGGPVLPLVDLEPGGGRYAAQVRTARGQVLLRAGGMALDDAGAGALPCALRRIEAMLAGFATGAAPAAAVAASPAAPEAALALLPVRAGDRRFLLPAEQVEAVARHRGAVACRAGDADECVVEVEGRLLPGISLSAWLGRPPPEGGEPWAVLLRDGGRRLALLVPAIDRLLRLPRAALQRIGHRRHVGRHLLDPDRGPVEVLRAADLLAGPAAEAAEPCPAEAAEPCPAEAPAPPPAMAAAPATLSVVAGGFACAFPALPGLRLLPGSALRLVAPRRPARGVPVLDLAGLLGGRPGVATESRLLLLERPAPHPPVALRVDAVHAGPAGEAWQPLPAAPPRLAALVAAVRPAGGGIEMLLRESALAGPRPRALAATAADALLGWLPPSGVAPDRPAGPVPSPLSRHAAAARPLSPVS